MKENEIIGSVINGYKIISKSGIKNGESLYKVKSIWDNSEGNYSYKTINDLNNTEYSNKKTYYDHTHKVWRSERLRVLFKGIKRRCYYPKASNYKYYGGKGVRICDEWLNNPKAFQDWCYSNGYDDTLTIDRIDTNGDYCPENCRWISKHDNSENTSKTNYIESYSISNTVLNWSRLFGISKNALYNIKRRKGDTAVQEYIDKRVKTAIDESQGKFPILFFRDIKPGEISIFDNRHKISSYYDNKSKVLTVNGKTKTCKEWSLELGFHIEHFNRMILEKGEEYTIHAIEELLKTKNTK